MSCTFWNKRRRLAAEKAKEQPVEIHKEPVVEEAVVVEPVAEEPVKPVEKPKRRVKKDGE